MTEETKTIQNSPMPEVPVKVTDLPSRGLGYPEGMMFYYRGYTYGEIKKISSSNEIDLPQIIEATMSGIFVKDNVFDKFRMSFVDMLYLGLLRRVSSQGHLKYQVPYACEKCEQESHATFGSQDIDFQDIDLKVKKFPLKTTIAGREILFSYPTVQNMLDVKSGKIREKGRKKGVPAVEIQASCIVNMPFGEAYDLLSNLTDDDDQETIAELDSALFHDIKAIKTICLKKVEGEDGIESDCNHTNYVSIEGKELLIRPFREGERSNRVKICFSDEQDS